MRKLLGLLVLLFSGAAGAADLNWSGNYRLEGVFLKNTNLVSKAPVEEGYYVHHLILRPEMIAADGITIRSKLDLFNGDNQGSQLGQYFGNNNANNTNTAATGRLPTGTIGVNELYLTWTSGYGSFIAGRVPVQFGLGLTHNAGTGEFDHWFDVKDIIGYKVVFGNFYVLPMIGKVREGFPDTDDEINDLMVQVMYENLDSDLTLGLFYQSRAGTKTGNDLSVAPAVPPNPYGGVNKVSDFGVTDFNIYIAKKLNRFGFALETAYETGDTGLNTGAGTSEVSLEGFAIAAELNYQAEDSKFKWNLKTGSISGNDPNSANKYEGYLIDRNYDIAMMMFNYHFGSGDTLGSGSFRDLDNSRYTDNEYLTNAVYVAPGVEWKWSDKWGANGRFTWGTLSRAQTGQDKALGMEFDFGVYYKPHDRLTVRSDAGVLFPGAAFKGTPAQNFENATAGGIITKAAVNF